MTRNRLTVAQEPVWAGSRDNGHLTVSRPNLNDEHAVATWDLILSLADPN